MIHLKVKELTENHDCPRFQFEKTYRERGRGHAILLQKGFRAITYFST